MIEVRPFSGDRNSLRALLLLADEPEPLAKYIDTAAMYVACDGDEIVGVIAVAETEPGTVEFKNVGVVEARHRQGVGRVLMERTMDFVRAQGYRRVVVATTIADTGNVRFYQRLGFRALSIVRDVFTPAAGYAPDEIDGIPMLDQIWFDRAL